MKDESKRDESKAEMQEKVKAEVKAGAGVKKFKNLGWKNKQRDFKDAKVVVISVLIVAIMAVSAKFFKLDQVFMSKAGGDTTPTTSNTVIATDSREDYDDMFMKMKMKKNPSKGRIALQEKVLIKYVDKVQDLPQNFLNQVKQKNIDFWTNEIKKGTVSYVGNDDWGKAKKTRSNIKVKFVSMKYDKIVDKKIGGNTVSNKNNKTLVISMLMTFDENAAGKKTRHYEVAGDFYMDNIKKDFGKNVIVDYHNIGYAPGEPKMNGKFQGGNPRIILVK